MRIAVTGYGAIAARHINIIKDTLGPGRFELLVCRERDVPLAPEHRWADMTTDFEDVLDFAPDCAVIASPATRHIEQAARLADIGAHLLIEKPLSVDLKGVDSLIGISEARGVAVLIGYNMAYLKTLDYLTGRIDSGVIGPVISIMAEVGQYLPQWRPHIDYRDSVSARSDLGGGALLELSHEIEYVDRLLGGTRTVFCNRAKSGLLDIDVEDSADILMEGVRGGTAIIHMNMLQKTPTRSCRVAGTDGVVTADIIAGEASIRLARGGGEEMGFKDASGDRGYVYREQMEHFFACARGESAPRVDCRRGRRVMELIAASRESAEGGAKILV
jgi:predicted dehydrogenase